MGFSDETEMLAKLYSLLHKKWTGSSLNWEKCLPSKYVGAMDYSLVEEVDQQVLSAQLKSGFQTYIDAHAANKKAMGQEVQASRKTK